MAGTTRLELATSAVTVSGLQVLSTTWKSTDGTVSHWKYTLAWIIHDLTGEKRKDALKGVMNTGFWRTRHSLSEHPRDDILLNTTAVVFLLPTPTHSS